MASTKVGVITKTDGTITMVVNPTDDSELATVPLKVGETLNELTKIEYQVFNRMVALATAKGWKIK